MTKITLAGAFVTVCLVPQIALGTDYMIDKEGQHAFVTFKASHLGYSYIIGHFENFSGHFTQDDSNPANSSASVSIDAKSLDTNHAERDKHLKGNEFFDVDKYPTITFTSTSFSGDKKAGELTGDLTMHGVTKSIVLKILQIGEGKDPWGGYRSGFQGNVTLSAAEFGLPAWVGEVDVELIVEGVRH